MSVRTSDTILIPVDMESIEIYPSPYMTMALGMTWNINFRMWLMRMVKNIKLIREKAENSGF